MLHYLLRQLARGRKWSLRKLNGDEQTMGRVINNLLVPPAPGRRVVVAGQTLVGGESRVDGHDITVLAPSGRKIGTIVFHDGSTYVLWS